MAESGFSYEKNFVEWLAKQVTPAQLSALYAVFADINKFGLNKKILKKPLFETDDLPTLAKLQKEVERNRFFAFTFRKQKNVMAAAMRHYCRFMKEEPAKKCEKNDDKPSETKAEETQTEVKAELKNEKSTETVAQNPLGGGYIRIRCAA